MPDQGNADRRRLARLATILVFAGGGLVVAAAPGYAAGDHDVQANSRTLFTETRSTDARSTVSEAYVAGRADRTRGANLRSRLIDLSRSSGLYYDDAYVDYVRLDRAGDGGFGTVELAVPRDFTVKTVELVNSTHDAGATAVSASVQGEVSATTIAYPDGPGFTSWSIVGSGQYILMVPGAGEHLSTWSKERLVDDGDAAYNYIAYKRKGTGKPHDIGWSWNNPLGIDYWVKMMDVWAYPSPNTPGIVHHWVDYEPNPGTTNDCLTVPIPISVSAGAFSTSLSYIRCGRTTVNLNYSRAGDMSSRYEVVNYDPPRREPQNAFAFVVALNGAYTGVTFFDYQRVDFWHDLRTVPNKMCDATNSGRTC